MDAREYFLLVAGVSLVMGLGAVLLGARQIRRARRLHQQDVHVPGVVAGDPGSAVAGGVPGNAGCAGVLIIVVGSGFLLVFALFLVAGLLVR